MQLPHARLRTGSYSVATTVYESYEYCVAVVAFSEGRGVQESRRRAL